MAQRTERGSAAGMIAAGLLAPMAKPLTRTQGKEGISVPLRSGHLASDGAQRFEDTFSVLKPPVLQAGDRDRIILITPDKDGAGGGNARLDLAHDFDG